MVIVDQNSELTPWWVAGPRSNEKKSELSALQVARLDELQEYDWESRGTNLDKQWNDMFQLLRKYKLEYGNTRVPQKELYKAPNLGNWVTSQHALNRNNKIRDDRKHRLEDCGFEWIRDERFLWKDTHPLGKLEHLWRDKFQALCAYKEEYQHRTDPRLLLMERKV
jgi:hypothetical protein